MTSAIRKSLANGVTNMVSQMVETVYVDDDTGVVDINTSFRKNNAISYIINKIEYSLKEHRIIFQKCKNGHSLMISDVVNKNTITSCDDTVHDITIDNFLYELKKFKNTYKEKYKFNGFLNKYVFGKKYSDLISKIKESGNGFSWAILPSKIYDMINSDKLCDMKIYKNPTNENKDIFFGRYDSAILIVNKKIDIKNKSNISEILIRYDFIENGSTKVLTVI